MIDLNDRVIIVVGASGALGGAIARQLVDVGATVVLGYYQRFDVIERLMGELEPLQGLAWPYSVDVTSRASVDDMVAAVQHRFGRIDVLVHGAAGEIDRHPFMQRTWEDFDRQLRTVVGGGFNCAQSVLEEMVLRREGKILFVLNALMDRPVCGYSPFITAVSAMRGLARDLANEVGEVGVTVNTVSPGFTVTEVTPHAPAAVQASLAHQTPLRRLAIPEDVARAVLFFVSDLSNFVTGENLVVDGGYSFGYGGVRPD